MQMRKKVNCVAALLFVALLAGNANAVVDNHWVVKSGKWSDPCSWSDKVKPGKGVGVPHLGDYAGHDITNAHLLIDSTVNAATGSLGIGDWLGSPGYAYLDMTGGTLNLTGNFVVGNRGYAFASWGQGWVNMSGGNAVVDGNLAIGVLGVGKFYLTGGTIQAQAFSVGIPDINIPNANVFNLMDIAGGKLLLAGNIFSLDPKVLGYGVSGNLNYAYEADKPGYTTITGIPEPATVLLLWLGSVAVVRTRRRMR